MLFERITKQFGEDERFGLHILHGVAFSNSVTHAFERARFKIVVSDLLALRSTA